jgi:hypothetical protein
MHVGGIFCYLEKALDCVSHESVLAKLHFYEIRGIYEDWFRSYLAKKETES